MSANQNQTIWRYPRAGTTLSASVAKPSYPTGDPVTDSFVTLEHALPVQTRRRSSTKASFVNGTKPTRSQSSTTVNEYKPTSTSSDAVVVENTEHYVDMIISGVQNLARFFDPNRTVHIDAGPNSTTASLTICFNGPSPVPSIESTGRFATPSNQPSKNCTIVQKMPRTDIVLLNTTVHRGSANDTSTSKVDEIIRMSKEFYTWDKVAYYILASVYTIGQAIEILIRMRRRLREWRDRTKLGV